MRIGKLRSDRDPPITMKSEKIPDRRGRRRKESERSAIGIRRWTGGESAGPERNKVGTMGSVSELLSLAT